MSKKDFIAMKNSGLIKDQYPNVKEINFELKYHDSDNMVDDSEKTLSWGPKNYAYFEFDCPYWECVDGGFDLSNEIINMLKEKKAQITGKKLCQGWQDRERVGQHRCWCELTYQISTNYK